VASRPDLATIQLMVGAAAAAGADVSPGAPSHPSPHRQLAAAPALSAVLAALNDLELRGPGPASPGCAAPAPRGASLGGLGRSSAGSLPGLVPRPPPAAPAPGQGPKSIRHIRVAAGRRAVSYSCLQDLARPGSSGRALPERRPAPPSSPPARQTGSQVHGSGAASSPAQGGASAAVAAPGPQAQPLGAAADSWAPWQAAGGGSSSSSDECSSASVSASSGVSCSEGEGQEQLDQPGSRQSRWGASALLPLPLPCPVPVPVPEPAPDPLPCCCAGPLINPHWAPPPAGGPRPGAAPPGARRQPRAWLPAAAARRQQRQQAASASGAPASAPAPARSRRRGQWRCTAPAARPASGPPPAAPSRRVAALAPTPAAAPVAAGASRAAAASRCGSGCGCSGARPSAAGGVRRRSR
jgi:hypothetical protein